MSAQPRKALASGRRTRPRSAGSTARTARDRILNAALDVFSEKGFGASSVQDVADAARMSKQALMHHCPSKELLREGVFALISQLLREQLPQAAAELVSRSTDRHRALLQSALHRFTEHRALSRFLVFELLERPEAVSAWLSTEAAPWIGLVHGVVEQSKGSPEGFDSRQHMTVLGMMMLAQSALVRPDAPRARRRFEQAVLRVMLLGSHLDPR